MPKDELSSGLELFGIACKDEGLTFVPPQQISFERGTINLKVGKLVSWQGANLRRTFTVPLSHNFLSDLPGTPKYPERLNEYLQSLSRRLENPRANAFMTLSGIPVSVEVEWPLRHSPDGRDALFIRASAEVMPGRDRIANLGVFVSGTLQVIAFPSLVPVLTESPIVNAIRKTIDGRTIGFFEPGKHPQSLQEVSLTTSDYETKGGFFFEKATDEEIRRLILRKVYWLGFGEGDQSTEVWICDPYDAEYSGTTVNRLKQLAQILAADGLVRLDTKRNFASASDSLLKQSTLFDEERRSALEGQPTGPQPQAKPEKPAAGRPSAFISYSSKDKDFAEKLANDLMEKKVGVWFDEWEIRVGDSLIEKIGREIRENDYLIVVLSPNSVASEWVKKELAEAMQREISEKRVVVLSVLYRQCQLPPFLKDKRYADFATSYESGFNELLRRFDR